MRLKQLVDNHYSSLDRLHKKLFSEGKQNIMSDKMTANLPGHSSSRISLDSLPRKRRYEE